jgi:Phage integrase SAM-like domain/Phage integrase family
MLNISFYLREPQAERDTPIIMVMILGGKKLKYPTNERIHPELWDFEKQRTKTVRKNGHSLEINAFLENLNNMAITAYREHQLAQHGQTPRLEDVKISLDRKLGRAVQFKTDLFGFFEKLIAQSESGVRLNPQTGQPIHPNTIKTYVTTIRHLREFKVARRKRLDFDDIDLEFYNEYTKFLIKEVKLATNTVGKHIQVLKLVMNEAMEMGYNKNLIYKSRRFVTVRENSDSIFLDKDELAQLEAAELSLYPKLERVRDLFLVGCYTGLRYSDYSILRVEHIKNDFIEIKQVKTHDPVVIPLHDAVKRIIKKYKGQLPMSMSNQKMNEYLKDLGEMTPCLQKPVARSFTKEGRRQQTHHAKWQLLTTHTARRSFATNEFLAGTPTLTIMAITGHKTEKAFLRYIKLVPSDHARLLKDHWERRKLVESAGASLKRQEL